jgi:Leucine-rich repeat (LRR) protein
LGSKVITGYYKNEVWADFTVKLYTFNANDSVKVSTKDAEVKSQLKGYVKGFGIEDNTNVEYLPIKLYKTFPNLVGYYISNCPVTEIDYSHFKKLVKLRSIIINYTSLKTIAQDTFKDLKNLWILNLAGGLLTSIDDQVFRNLVALKDLNIMENDIETISINAFDNLTELQNLTLSDNSLSSFSDDHFKNNTLIDFIQLGNNTLTSLSPTMFDKMENLYYIGFSNNTCIDGDYNFEEFADMKEKIKNNCQVK